MFSEHSSKLVCEAAYNGVNAVNDSSEPKPSRGRVYESYKHSCKEAVSDKMLSHLAATTRSSEAEVLNTGHSNWVRFVVRLNKSAQEQEVEGKGKGGGSIVTRTRTRAAMCLFPDG